VKIGRQRARLYSAFLGWALYQSYWIVTPFLALFAIGFFYTSLLSLKETRAQLKVQTKLETVPMAATKSSDRQTAILTEAPNSPKAVDTLLIAE